MEEHVETPNEYGIFIVDRRLKSVVESINQLADYMFGFSQLSQRQRINLRNRTERLGVLLDWKKLGTEYRKARFLAIKRNFPDIFNEVSELKSSLKNLEVHEKMPRPFSVPPSPKPTDESK